MAEHSKIEWTDATWNPITGCSLVSEGCRHCYAARLAATRLKNHPSRAGLARLNRAGEAKFTGEVRFNEDWIAQPLRWQRARRIFVCAHGDLFHEAVPNEWIDRVFAVMALASRHTFQVLTKRPERATEYLSGDGLADRIQRWTRLHVVQNSPTGGPVEWPIFEADLPLPNVWLGTSVEDQATANARIPHLLAAPAALHFLSAEPLLGRVVIPGAYLGLGDNGSWPHPENPHARIGWIIVGGESGPGARPMDPAWARSLREQCRQAGVPFHFKQWGAWVPAEVYSIGDSLGHTRSHTESGEPFPGKPSTWWAGDARGGEISILVGKARAGRLLDGRTWDGMPEPAR